MPLHTHRVYFDARQEISLRCAMGWCAACAALRPIERFDDTVEIEAELKDIETTLASRCRFWWMRLGHGLIPPWWCAIQALRDDVDALQRRRVLINQRRGDEACLDCDSRAVQPFTGDYGLTLGEGFFFVGRKATGFHHLGCGDEFIAEGTDVRFHLVPITKRYSFEGTLLDELRG